jgi:hypothetical protein
MLPEPPITVSVNSGSMRGEAEMRKMKNALQRKRVNTEGIHL